MTRHARNCTAGAVYTYHEKKKDASSSGYGTNSERIGKDSVKDFDCCSLTLQPCRIPVVTKDGYLFDKEAILQYIIKKKNEYSRKLKEYEKQLKQQQAEENELKEAETLKRNINFLNLEKNIITNKNGESSISNMAEGRDKQLPSFWVPSKTPESLKAQLKKPDSTIYCPVSGKPLKAKDLIEVKFTEIQDDNKIGTSSSFLTKRDRYICAVTRDTLSNSIACAVLKPTGDVVTMDCVEKIIKKDWIHPLTSQPLTEKDIIPLQRGGTGYSTTNEKLEGKHYRPVLQA